ncbi:MAG: TonB family protein [Bacteriovoracia bacterium]
MQSVEFWQKEKDLPKFVGMALTVHVIVFIIIFGWAVLREFLFPVDDVNMKLIQQSVKVDIVAMPKLTVKELEKVTPAKEQVSEEENKVVIEENEADEELAQFLNELSKKKTPKRKAKKKLKKKKASSWWEKLSPAQRKKLTLTGNKISFGVAIIGDNNNDKIDGILSKYANSVKEEVRVHWRLPSYLQNKDFRAVFRLYIARNGNLIRAEKYKTSGSTEYDQAALQAIKKAEPFQRPPQEVSRKTIGGNILLGFPL